MSELNVTRPMHGCRVVSHQGQAMLFGQPPEVLKAILKSRPGRLESLILPDTREHGGALLNNVEFLLYYFLFFENGLDEGRRLNLVGDPAQVRQVMEVLRLTLLGPTDAEYEAWGTQPVLAREWRDASDFFALKDAQGEIRPVESYFHIHYWRDDEVRFDGYLLRHVNVDTYSVTHDGETVDVVLDDIETVAPPYVVERDYVANPLVKLGVDVLGGASGFSPGEPSTGLALATDGHYLLIDAIPYVDVLMRARGISVNQVTGVFLTHLHDDHCNMFPLMRAPHKLDVVTTREIFDMAMTKLAMGLGWTVDVVSGHFNFVEIKVGEPLRYFGLEIIPHHTVHSIPTVGAIFRAQHQGRGRDICIVGDIQTFTEIAEMRKQGLIQEDTEQSLQELYSRRFDVLVADGGMGPIHGDPADALGSKSDRVLFVHVEKLPERFNATFSLASSGKRYTVVEGESDVYTTLAIEFLARTFGAPPSTRWLSTLFADKQVKRFNTDDVIIKQDAETWGKVFLVLTGYCEVIYHDGEQFITLGSREAGDFMGEMAIVTGTHIRNASVVARTPVTVCEFSEATFDAFIEAVGVKSELLARWTRRAVVSSLPQFSGLTTTVVEQLCANAEVVTICKGDSEPLREFGEHWGIIISGDAIGDGDALLGPHEEVGSYRPHACWKLANAQVSTNTECELLCFPADRAQRLVEQIPQLNYTLRKYRMRSSGQACPWVMGD